MEEDRKKYTAAFGIPVGEDQDSLTAGERGPVLIQGVHLFEKLSYEERAKAMVK
jgi:catalase